MVAATLIVLVVGCDVLSLDRESSDLAELIEQNREAWEAQGVDTYEFTYDRRTGETETNDVHVVVRRGGIDSVSIGGRGIDNPEEFLTIDRLYAEIVRNFERTDREDFEVQFDEERSYLERYCMFSGEGTVGRGVVVTTFQGKN